MADVEACSSRDSLENGDGCSLVLELTEDDPLFHKKKKLLNDKGFGVKEQIHLQSSMCPDSISNSLETMLRIGRIIHVDEVELYFGEFDTQMGFYSPRNELETLNSILARVNTLLSHQMHKKMNVWQGLQAAIILKIQEFGNQIKEVARIDKNYTCEKEKCLVQWGESNGVKTKLEIAYVGGAGRGAVAMEDLRVGDIALEIPVSIILSEDLVHKSDMYNVLGKIEGMSSETMLLLWSMKEKHNCGSKFKNYFDSLPKEFHTGLSFGVDAIMALEGTLLLEEIMQAKEKNVDPEGDEFRIFKFRMVICTCALNMMSCFLDYKSFLIKFWHLPSNYEQSELNPHIVHYGRVDSATNSLKFPLSRPCNIGEQCCLSYGNFSTSHLITFYGFSPQGDNRYDVIPIDIDVGQADCFEDCPMSNWTTHMVRVLEDLQSTFSNMMEILGDTDFGDGENTSWDVKLALEFKDLQRRIISSILTSCSAGRSLVESELSRVMSKD
ncbi:SET domain-containing protein [Citrus sinensis]|uniref:SET domain-containing protein n=1 Tax=Citrus sinensis TaxID=2711 RepID=A0ACB8P657_CITSI|nr:SET domain-containing protein [Citrus sinensis]